MQQNIRSSGQWSSRDLKTPAYLNGTGERLFPHHLTKDIIEAK